MTLNHIMTAIKELRNIIINLKLETLSIAKTDYINNVPWINIKSLLQLLLTEIIDCKLIIRNGLVKYPPNDLRPVIIGEMHCLTYGRSSTASRKPIMK